MGASQSASVRRLAPSQHAAFLRSYRGREPVLFEGLPVAKALAAECLAEYYTMPKLLQNRTSAARLAAPLLERHADVALPVRPALTVARVGGAFEPSATLPLRELAALVEGKKRAPLVFSTARDGAWRALREEWDVPEILRGDSAQPILSVGGGGFGSSGGKEEESGLAFHKHDGSWLHLLIGSKRWLLRPPESPPPPGEALVRRKVHKEPPSLLPPSRSLLFILL